MSPSSKVGTIEQEVIITRATPAQVFEVLMDETAHAALTGGEAKIARQVGGTFTTFDGWATGVTRELVEGQKIVQTWRADDWPVGAVSTCTYALRAVPNGTKIVFRQTDVPKAMVSAVAKGWQQYYWKPLQKKFA